MTLPSGTYQAIFAAQVEGYGWLYIGENMKPSLAAHVFKTPTHPALSFQGILLTAAITIPEFQYQLVLFGKLNRE